MPHKHHIIPKHAGGTDDPSNIILLSVTEHAEAHKKLYEEYGRWQDYVAWQGLAKLTPKEELTRMMHQNTQRKLVAEGNHHFLGGKIQHEKLENGTHKFLDTAWQKEKAQKIRNSGKCALSNKPKVTCPHCNESGDIGNMRQNHFEYCDKNPTKIVKPLKIISCIKCGYTSTQSPNFFRYHNNNCKSKNG